MAHGCCTRLRARACLRSVFACLGLAAKAKCYYNPRLLRCRLGTLVCVGTIHILSPQRVGGGGTPKAEKRKGGFPDNDCEKGRGVKNQKLLWTSYVDGPQGWRDLAGSTWGRGERASVYFTQFARRRRRRHESGHGGDGAGSNYSKPNCHEIALGPG